ncbi:hypothetical protein WR25_24524 [Diploscapter pachys]|uniref:Uncharacterized protein n=1 Tax=Diploscapter pachys TaxID=2018661 RepID=A0A2A2L7X6_9BILA|nr:hypothetical protein WR25_24524 [Diploscapter pachys]
MDQYFCPTLQRRISNEKELQIVLNELQTEWNQQATVHIVNGCTHRGIEQTLLIICCPSNSASLCLSRIHCLFCNSKIGFEIEPQPHFPFLFPVQRFPSFQYSICAYSRFFTFGITSIVGLALKRQSAIWKYVETKCKTPQRNRRRIKSGTATGNGGNDDTASSILMENVPEEVVVEGKASSRGSSLLNEASPVSVSRRRQCWMSIPSPEMINRAEKLLRASTFEMMLCLVAGTLRAFFRDKGLPHPPDIGAVMPFCCRAYMPVAANKRCDTVLLPIQLPTSCEGAIPRLWSIQRRLSRAIGGSVPSSLRLSCQLASVCLPSSFLSSVFSSLYSSNSIYVAYYRSTGDFKISSNSSIDSIVQFPSLADSIKASFIFIEHGRELTLCASLCKTTFPDPDAILHIFRRDTIRLLDHLSVRLLSLPQSTFLPGMALFSGDTISSQYDSNHMQQTTLPEIKMDLSGMSEQERQKQKQTEDKEDYSLEQLYELLSTVQNELDGMRANPQGDRNEHIQRLKTLEERMQKFHECIIKKHGIEGMDLDIPDEGCEAGDAVLHVLAPYLEECECSVIR